MRLVLLNAPIGPGTARKVPVVGYAPDLYIGTNGDRFDSGSRRRRRGRTGATARWRPGSPEFGRE